MDQAAFKRRLCATAQGRQVFGEFERRPTLTELLSAAFDQGEELDDLKKKARSDAKALGKAHRILTLTLTKLSELTRTCQSAETRQTLAQARDDLQEHLQVVFAKLNDAKRLGSARSPNQEDFYLNVIKIYVEMVAAALEWGDVALALNCARPHDGGEFDADQLRQRVKRLRKQYPEWHKVGQDLVLHINASLTESNAKKRKIPD